MKSRERKQHCKVTEENGERGQSCEPQNLESTDPARAQEFSLCCLHMELRARLVFLKVSGLKTMLRVSQNGGEDKILRTQDSCIQASSFN